MSAKRVPWIDCAKGLGILLVILAAVILSVFLSRIFAGTVAKPVRMLSSFAHEIGHGDLRQQEFSFHDIEFDDLAVSMNGMVSDLNDARQKQEIFFPGGIFHG